MEANKKSFLKGETSINDMITDSISEHKDSAVQLVCIMEQIGSTKKMVQSLMDQNKDGKIECNSIKLVVWEQCDIVDVGLTEALQAMAFALGSIVSMELVERFI